LKQTSASEKKYYAERWTKKTHTRSTIIHDEDEDGIPNGDAKKPTETRAVT
jgi:hypothetical protein